MPPAVEEAAPPPPPVKPPARAEPPPDPPAAKEPSPPPPPEPPTPDPEPAAKAEPKAPAKAEPDPKEPAPAEAKPKLSEAAKATPAAPVVAGDRAPDPLPAESYKGEMKLFRLRPSPKAKERRFRLPTDQPVSEAVAKLLGMLLPLRTDAAGRLSHWYRFAQGGVRPVGNPTMGSFDDSAPIDLEQVLNRVVPAQLRVETEGGQVSLHLQLGTAVPACGIVDNVATMLSLPAGRWRLYAGERCLEAHEILEDLAEIGTDDLVMRR